MTKIATQTSERQATVGVPTDGTASARPWTVGELLHKALKGLASLRLTVVFFGLGIFLVFSGTLAMVDEGLWTVLAKYFRSWFVVIPFQVFVRFGQVFFGVSKDLTIGGGIPFLGGWSIGAVLMTNLLAAHLVRFKFSLKRSGILLIHSGIVVMMVGEFITGLYQVEGHLRIPVGGSSNYLEHHLNMELAVIRQADAATDDVVVVPGHLLKKKQVVRHDDLPFDIEPLQYMTNARITRTAADEAANPATHGLGRIWFATPAKEIGGAESGSRVDLPSAYVRLKKKNSDEVLGTYLVSYAFDAQQDSPQQVAVGEDTYEVSFRRQRLYKPYTVHLEYVRTDKYKGSNMASEFSSSVRLVDPSRNEDRQALISMNSPLRYGGETFYQSQVLGQDEITVLQVVRNPGVLLPYLSCILVSFGMLVHFGMGLTTFLRQRVSR